MPPPVQRAPIAVQETKVKVSVKKPARKKHRVAPKVEKEKMCYPVKHIKHPKRKRAKRVKSKIEFIIRATPPVIPPPPPPPIDPCLTGHCAPDPCHGSLLKTIKGPCADPRTPCVERVTFNDKGQAIRVVLEPQAVPASKPYFEYQQYVHASDSSRKPELSLVVPLAKESLAIAVMGPVRVKGYT
jgi:hypothetical protein